MDPHIKTTQTVKKRSLSGLNKTQPYKIFVTEI